MNKLTISLLLFFCTAIQPLAIAATLSDTLILDNVTVSATRATNTEPTTFQNISASTIASVYHGQDPSALLERLSPSILAYSDAGPGIGNYVQFRLRGIDQSRINTTLNGAPLNDMIDQGVFFSNFSDFGSSIRSLQVQRGVGASSSGVASYAGSINFQSEGIFSKESTGSLSLLGGSFSTLRTSAEFNSGLSKNNWGGYGRFSKTQSNGYKDHSGSDSYSMFFSGGKKGNDYIFKVTAFAGKTQNDQSYLPVLISDIESNPKTNYNHPNDTDDFEQEMIQVQYAKQFANGWNMSNTLYYGGARGIFPFGLDNTTQLVFGLENNHFGAISNWSTSTDKWTIHTGIHAYRFDRKNINYTAPNVSVPDYLDESHKDEFSIFGKLNYDLGNTNLFADLQLRTLTLSFIADEILSFGGAVPSGGIDHSRNWTFFNGKVGLSHAISNHSTLYASYGRTGREPTRTDILQGDGSAINEFNFFSAQDEDVVLAEYVNDLELGWRYVTSDLSLDLNLFHMSFDNEISQVGALAARSYVAVRQNVQSSRRSGLELLGSYAASNRLSFGLNATYLNTNVSEFNSGSEVFTDVNHVFAPNLILSPGFSYEMSADVTFSFAGKYVSESFIELSNDPAFTLPSYFVANVQLDLSLTEQVDVRLFANNIFNQQFFNDGAPVDIDFDGNSEGPGYRVQAPTNVYLLLTWNF